MARFAPRRARVSARPRPSRWNGCRRRRSSGGTRRPPRTYSTSPPSMRSPSSARASPSTATAPARNSNETDAAARTTGSTSPARESCGAHRARLAPGERHERVLHEHAVGLVRVRGDLDHRRERAAARSQRARTKASCSRCASAASRVPSSSRRCAAAKPGRRRGSGTPPRTSTGASAARTPRRGGPRRARGMPSINGSREPRARTSDESPTMMDVSWL